MTMSNPPKSSKEFTREEKLAILKQAAADGVKSTLEKHQILSGTYYYWKRTLLDENISVIKSERRALEKEVRQLRAQNRELKVLLVDEQLRSALKDELLQKKLGANKS